ncbi:MAG TPA: FecR domain-containing protein [Terriglobales bacterium]|nr:FecR domain-containing protein [Terriglobales bacterium]
MNRQNKDTSKSLLKDAIDSIRTEQPDPDRVGESEARLWAQSGSSIAAAGAIHGCADIRALLDDYKNKKLAVPRALLVEAHLHECVSCSRYFERVSAPAAWSPARPSAASQPLPWKLYAVAAMIVVAIGAAALFMQSDRVFAPPGPRATVESIDGGLYRVSDSGEQAVRPGDQFAEDETIRTPNGGHAFIRLSDGSRVEMNERAEFSVSQGRKNTTVHLERGDILIQAAHRTSGHLYVLSKDCRVAVTGTIFAVSSGIRDSRVSVVEGAVEVSYSGEEQTLHPGDGLSTSGAEAVSVKKEIAWSHNLDQYLQLLAQFSSLEKKLATIPLPGLRYSSRLLRFMPQNTMLYASSPNYGDALKQADQLLHDQLQSSDVLNKWWEQVNADRHPSLEEMIEKFQTLSQYLGEEAVFSVVQQGERCQPLILAEVQRAGLREYLESEAAKTNNNSGGRAVLEVLDASELNSVIANPRPRSKLFVVVLPEYVLVSPDPDLLKSTIARIESGSESGFAETPYGQLLTNLYSNGAGLLFTADIARLHQYHAQYQKGPRNQEGLSRSGFGDLKYLVAESKNVNSTTENHAVLIFNGPRHGVASWLAAPAPMGALEFLSPQASAVASFVVKKPEAMFDDLVSFAQARNPQAQSELEELQSKLNFRLRDDFASTLGGEATLALDGPVLPTPSWKFIIEVNDSGRLQNTLRTLVEDHNAEASQHNHPELAYDETQFQGRTYYHVHALSADSFADFYYTFADGYMIAGPSRAILVQAIAIRNSSDSLARSSQFLALLPQNSQTNVSALYYQNLAPLLDSVAGLTPSQLQSLREVAANSKPSMAVAYGEESRIEFVTNGKFPGLDPDTLALTRLLDLAKGTK